LGFLRLRQLFFNEIDMPIGFWWLGFAAFLEKAETFTADAGWKAMRVPAVRNVYHMNGSIALAGNE